MLSLLSVLIRLLKSTASISLRYKSRLNLEKSRKYFVSLGALQAIAVDSWENIFKIKYPWELLVREIGERLGQR